MYAKNRDQLLLLLNSKNGKFHSSKDFSAEDDVWSGSTLFAYRNFYVKYNNNENIHKKTLKLEMDSSQW